MDKKVVVTEGGHLLLPDGLRWHGVNHHLLFVRAAYEPLFQMLFHGPKDPYAETIDATRKWVVSGQAGIGKSAFAYVLAQCRYRYRYRQGGLNSLPSFIHRGPHSTPPARRWYTIYKLLTAGRPVLYADESAVYYFHPAASLVTGVLGSASNVADIATNLQFPKEGVIVADSCFVPIGLDSAAVITASRAVLEVEERTRRFGVTISKLARNTLCMPIPTDRELEELRVVAFPHVSPEVFKARLDAWGPIPREIFGLDEADAFRLGMLKRGADGRATCIPRRIPLERAMGECGGGSNTPLPVDDSSYFNGDPTIYYTTDALRPSPLVDKKQRGRPPTGAKAELA